MSNSKRSSYFYSPLKVESDQKDVIIAHLQQEIYLLRKNQQGLFQLEDQYRALEHKFRLLAEEKAHGDADFKERHDLALRTIGQLKNQIEALRADLREKHLQLGDLESDENTLNGQLDQRAIQIQKLKNELTSLLADSEELLNEKLRLEQAAIGIRKDNDLFCQDIKKLSLDNDATRRKTDDLDKYHQKLKTQEGILKDKILSYENENNSLDNDITSLMDEVSGLENEGSNAQSELISLQKDIAQIGGLSDKYKSQALHYHKATQAEIMRNNDLTKILNQTQNTHRMRVCQVDEGNQQVDNFKKQNEKLNNINGTIRDDIQFCRKHLQNIALLNSDLAINLEKYSEEDEVVRNLIDRRARVIKVRNRVEQSSGILRASTYIETGSARKSKLNY